MRDYSLTHLTDDVLLRDLDRLIVRDRVTTARLLAHIAEVDLRKLYVPAGHSSMHAYCVKRLRLSEGAAFKRIGAARAARAFPRLFPAVAEGRLHLAGVCLLAPYLTPENVDELMAAATHRRKSEIEAYLARRFPLQEVPKGRTAPEVVLRAIPASRPRVEDPVQRDLLSPGTAGSGKDDELSPGIVTGDVGLSPRVANGRDELSPGTVGNGSGELSPGRVEIRSAKPDSQAVPAVTRADEEPCELSPGTVGSASGSPATHTPQPERYLLKLVLDKETHDLLRYAQALLSHSVPSGDVAQVLRRGLEALIPQLEKGKFGATKRATRSAGNDRPNRAAVLSTPKSRHIPAHIRRAVWKRDQGRCTFIGTNGHRCNPVRRLEFDHVEPHVRHPEPTFEGLRLRCRAHNQHEAERVGVAFISRKREEALVRRRVSRVSLGAPEPSPSPS